MKLKIISIIQMTEIKNIEDFEKFINDTLSILYFSNNECNVCKVLKPKLEENIKENFEKVKIYYCDVNKYPEISAQNSVFSIPTIIVFNEGKELLRFNRFLNIVEFNTKLERIYNLLY